MQTRQSDQREARAAAFLRAIAASTDPTRRPRHASATDLGIAATQNDRQARWLPRRVKSVIGLEVGVALVKAGVATVTKGNRFELLPVSS
jgi:hypothetical protein